MHRSSTMKRFAILAVLAVALVAQTTWQARAAENNAKAAETRILDDLKFLASDKCEGRGVSTKGINVAADYIADEFKKAGLKPGGVNGTWFQPFAMTGSTRMGDKDKNRLVLTGPLGQRIELEMGKGFSVVAFGNSGQVKAPLVFAGYGISSKEPAYDDYDKQDVAGKVVVVLRRVPQHGNPHVGNFTGNNNPNAALQYKASNAELHKAAAVIFVNDPTTANETNDNLMDFNYTASSREAVGIPLLHVRRSTVNMMLHSALGTSLPQREKSIDADFKSQSAALPGWTCELQTDVNREKLEVKNVIGVLEGKGALAEETIVIGAHYDHLGYGGAGSLARGSKDIHYGADDNGSGTVSLIELARRFGGVKERQGRRIVFMAFTGEEMGLLGSAHYCNKQPLFALDKTAAMLNMDMVGRLRDDKLTVYGTGTAKGFSELVDKFNEKHQFKISKVAAGFGPSDHSSFYGKQIPVFHFFTGTHPEYHKPTDKVETINVEGIRKITDLIEEMAVKLSTDEKRPEYVRVAGGANPGGPRGPTLGVMPNYDDEKGGLLLDGVSPGRPAEKAGLKAGDRIVEIAGKPVKNVTGYMTIMAGFKRGDTFELTAERDGKPMKFKVALE